MIVLILNHSNEKSNKTHDENQSQTGIRALFKAAYDLSQIFAYIKKTDDFFSEFVYQSGEIGTVQQLNHTYTLVNIQQS